MSDNLRKDFSDKVKEGATPNEQKGTFEKAKEFVTDKADQLAGHAQPDTTKSSTQKLGDTLSGKN